MSKKCKWRFCEEYDMESGHWDTQCGNAFTIMEGSPNDNVMKFCPFCGREIWQLKTGRKEQSK